MCLYQRHEFMHVPLINNGYEKVVSQTELGLIGGQNPSYVMFRWSTQDTVLQFTDIGHNKIALDTITVLKTHIYSNK